MEYTPGTDEKPYSLHVGNTLDAYGNWPSPDLIVSDGAYGVSGFRGDTDCAVGLPDWYRPHLLAWQRAAKPSTSLWFWNTEVGWATVHPLLLETGWEYVQLAVWDKGIAHVAGNVNGKTIRQLPVVTEVSALYRRKAMLESGNGRMLDMKHWLRSEWLRSGLPLSKANEACGVKNMATRKYLALDKVWCRPFGNVVEKMARYCMENGNATTRPYFSLDGITPVSAEKWEGLRATWNHQHGLTNVWHRNPLSGMERIRDGESVVHLNQKPLDLMSIQISATTNPGDVVWEPFGGLASASVAAVMLGRKAFVAETNIKFAELARQRLGDAWKQVSPQ